MAFVEDDLGGHVFRSSTERPGLLATSDLFGKTKVDLETSSPLATPPQNLSGSWHGSPGFILRTSAGRGYSPAWCSLQRPASDSRASGLGRGRPYDGGNRTPRWRSPRRIWLWVLQNFPWNKGGLQCWTRWGHWSFVLPVSEQTPHLPTQTGFQQHVDVFVIFKCAIQPGGRGAQAGQRRVIC